MGGIEQVEHLKQTEADREIREEYSQDIQSSDLQYLLSGHLHTEQEGNGNEQYREWTRVNAVQDGGEDDERQEECSPIAHWPKELAAGRAVFK